MSGAFADKKNSSLSRYSRRSTFDVCYDRVRIGPNEKKIIKKTNKKKDDLVAVCRPGLRVGSTLDV